MSNTNGGIRFSIQEQDLQSCIARALQGLEERWWRCLWGSQTSSASSNTDSPFSQLGKRLGQFAIHPRLALEALSSKLALLKETEAIRAKKRLNVLDEEATRILARQLPNIERERKPRDEELARLEGSERRSGWSGSLWEIGFYFAISMALFASEFSLATQVTQEALFLKDPWVFSLALACLTLAFKFLADRFFNDLKHSGLIYTLTMIVLFLVLMFPLSSLRTTTILNRASAIEDFGSSGVQWADEGAANGVDGATDPQSMPSSQEEVPGGVGSSQSVYLGWSFYLASILFPLLSGAGFSRMQRAMDLYGKERESKRRKADLSVQNGLLEREYRELQEKLGQVTEEMSQLIDTLGSSLDSTSFLAQKLRAFVVDEANREDLDLKAADLIANPGAETLNNYLLVVRRELASDRPFHSRDLQIDYYSRLLHTSVNSRQTSRLDLLQAQLASQAKAEMEVGYKLGKSTTFQVFAGEDKQDLLRISDLKTYHRLIFDEDTAELTEVDSSNGVEE